VVELLPALAVREPTSGYLFYDCQTDDARLVLTVLGEAERFGACVPTASMSRVFSRTTAAQRGARPRRRDGGDLRRAKPRTSSMRPACGPTSSVRTSFHLEAELPVDQAEPRDAYHDPPLRPAARRRRDRPRRQRSLDLRAAVAGPRAVGTTDNDYEGPLEHIEPSGEDIVYLLDAVNEFFGFGARAGPADGGLRRSQAADLHGDPKKSVAISSKGRAL